MATQKSKGLADILSDFNDVLEGVNKAIRSKVPEREVKQQFAVSNPSLGNLFQNKAFHIHTQEAKNVSPYTVTHPVNRPDNPFRDVNEVAAAYAKAFEPSVETRQAQKILNQRRELKRINKTVVHQNAISQSRLDRLRVAEKELREAYEKIEQLEDANQRLDADKIRRVNELNAEWRAIQRGQEDRYSNALKVIGNTRKENAIILAEMNAELHKAKLKIKKYKKAARAAKSSE
jgi:hypothetical protein